MRKAVSVLAAAAASFAAFSPAMAQTNGAPVCSGSYEDIQSNSPMYVDVGIEIADFCTDPDGDQVTIHSIFWGPGTSGVGSTSITVYQIGYGPETLPIVVTDGQGNYTNFDLVYWRHS